MVVILRHPEKVRSKIPQVLVQLKQPLPAAAVRGESTAVSICMSEEPLWILP